MSQNIDLVEIKAFLIDLARNQVGPLIKSKAGKEKFVDKANAVDLVTEIDKQVEKIVLEAITEKYPQHKFIGEETYQPGVTVLTDEPTFVVDPIDGTINFIHNFPYSCTSLGFAINKKPVIGVVYNPHMDMMFHAIEGQGAYLNDTLLPKLTEPLTLQKSVVAFESGAEREGNNFRVKIDTYESLLSKEGAFIHGTRTFGSAAMNMCHVALGAVDAYWEGGPWAWDVCASWCILKETGGKLVGANPGQWDIEMTNRNYFAVRGCTDQDAYIQSFWNYVKGELKY